MSTFDDIKQRLITVSGCVTEAQDAADNDHWAHDALDSAEQELKAILADWPAAVYREQADALTAEDLLSDDEREMIEAWRDYGGTLEKKWLLAIIDRISPRPEEAT